MGEVTPIDRYRVRKTEYVFECPCGGQQFYLHKGGRIECGDCRQNIDKLEWLFRDNDVQKRNTNMSWSVSAVGRASAVAQKLEKDIASIKCTEPEETIKNGVASIIAHALAAYPDHYAVSVSASGSQSAGYDPSKPGVASGLVNNLTVSISPLYGFVG